MKYWKGNCDNSRRLLFWLVKGIAMAPDGTRDSNSTTEHYLLEVIDRDGWRNEFPLHKNVVHIGSSSRSDIVLEPTRGEHVAPLHAQLIVPISKEGRGGRVGRCQLVNLGDEDIRLGISGDRSLPPRSAIQLESDTAFKLGQFTLVLRGNDEDSDELTLSSQHIGLSLSLSRTQLEPNRCLEGVVKVSNLGQRSGVQIELDLEGMDPDCYDLEPGPILSSGAEKEVFFRLRHHGRKPPAGNCHITFRATAPHSYPGEEAQVSQLIEVLPFFQYKMRLLPAHGISPSQTGKTQQPDLDPTISSEHQVEPHQAMSSAVGPSAPPGRTDQPSGPKAEGEVSPPQPSKGEHEAPNPSPTGVRDVHMKGTGSGPTRENRWSQLLAGFFSRPRQDSTEPAPAQPTLPQQPRPAHSETTIPPTLDVQRPADESQTLEEVDVHPPSGDDHAEVEQVLHKRSSKPAHAGPPAHEPDSGEPVAVEPGPTLSASSENQATEGEGAVTHKAGLTPEAGLSTPPLTGHITPAPQDVPLPAEAPEVDAEAVPEKATSSVSQDLPPAHSPRDAGSPPDSETTQPEFSPGEPAPQASEHRQEPSEKPPEPQPPAAQDWWLPAEDQGNDEASVLRLKAHPPDATKTTNAGHKDSPLAQDWWTPEGGSAPQGVEPDREAPVLKLKATPPTDADMAATPQDLSTPADEWWSEAGEAEAEPPKTERRVLRLKTDSSETEPD
jgi:hypothetical protein